MYLFVRKRPWTPPNLLSWDEPLGTPAPASEGVAELRSLDSSWDFAMRTVAMSEDKACPAFSAGNRGHFQPGPRQKLGSNARTKEVSVNSWLWIQWVLRKYWNQRLEGDRIISSSHPFSSPYVSFIPLSLCFLCLCSSRPQSRWKLSTSTPQRPRFRPTQPSQSSVLLVGVTSCKVAAGPLPPQETETAGNF